MSMPEQPDIFIEGGTTIKVRGNLNVTNVAQFWSSGIELMAEVDSVVIDLAESEVVGSAVVALLIAWQREAGRLGKALCILHAPENLIAIAKACGVDGIIPFEPPVSEA
jgi:ABC-type transporter Mla MlaB component